MKILYAAAATFLLMIFMNGCYTVLQHPKVDVKESDGTYYHSDVNFYDDCSSCHNSESAEYHAYSPKVNAVNTYHYDEGYYGSNYYGDYNEYYNTPWWYGYSAPEEEVKYRDQGNSGGGSSASSTLRNSDGGRSQDRGRSNNDYNDPGTRAVRTNGSGSGSGSSNTSTTNSSGSESRNSSSSSSTKSERSETPKTRNNDSGRSNSGRR